MQIKNMFEKQIDRDIKGVIKVGQSDEENVYQELDEYVVTKELLRHFRDFFNNYEKGVDGYTDKMGVWISGFFGSGKSHFLKILSYLLKNSTVEGKRAIEYFTDGKKIEDPMLIAEMTKAGTIESDVMLFNIDSKGSAKVGSGKEAIVEVFMKVFNEMQGYCGSIPYLAEFERQLDNEGRFEEFKEKFEGNAGAPWEKKRQAFAVIQDKVVKTLVEMDFMSEEAARNWCKNAKGSYDLSIEKFVSLVQEYCAKKGPNHHVIFLVDEIGQYIADDTQLMLNLQTIVEDLGTACKGKAWVIVTSQEDIDSITKTKGNDFSKIQGRFDTRLSLSASNVDEVIRKRVLAKNETATQTLRLLYEQKESIIKNLITFTADTADKKLYADKADFADCYPFIPYQFNLLGQVLTAVRTHGASGKHLSDQSRSMLALFQESAIRVMDKEDGVLVPFSFFYDPLHKFIDHQHSQVISDAENNSKLDEFDVELLKVLFMIKYVKEIKANVDNLTTLMISNIDDERIEVRSKIEESLKKLIKETLVQKNGEIYIFLTNEEQEINNAINNESVEMGEIIGEASTVIYGLQDELTPEVEDKDVTVRKADLQRDIKSLVSYAVGCMFGRYSLDEEGLVLAGQPFEAHFFEASAPVCGTGFAGAPGASVPIGEFYYKTDEGVKKCTYNPDKDNIIPICDEEYFSDDIVSRFCEWVKIVYGEKSLETNLDFIAKALGNKGNTSREVIRNYFLNDFFKDHCNTYSVTGSGKRPIYWLFDSGKQNGFKALIYMHRYDADTVGRVRTDYLHEAQKYVETAMQSAQYTIDNATSASEKSKATKAVTKYTKQLAEMKIYDEAIAHVANQRIEIDLDDGVKVNYAKFQGVEVAQEGKKALKVDLLAKI